MIHAIGQERFSEQWDNMKEMVNDGMHEEEENFEIAGWDDVSGKPLDPQKVMKARREEIVSFRKHKVYRRVPRGTSYAVSGKQPKKIRWIDINKGDEKSPNYRPRLVAKEINRCKSLDMYAATPPLESIKFIISMAASTKSKSATGFPAPVPRIILVMP